MHIVARSLNLLLNAMMSCARNSVEAEVTLHGQTLNNLRVADCIDVVVSRHTNLHDLTDLYSTAVKGFDLNICRKTQNNDNRKTAKGTEGAIG